MQTFSKVKILRTINLRISLLFQRSLSFHQKCSQNHKYPHPKNGISYLNVPGDKPLLGKSIGQLFDKTTFDFASKEAVYFKNQNLRKTFGEIRKDVDDFSKGLISLGISKNERIGIWSPNCYEWYVTKIAAAKIGLILVNINPAYQGQELLYAINKVRMRAIVIGSKFRKQNYYEILSTVIPSIFKSEAGKVYDENAPSLSHIISMTTNETLKGTFSFAEISSKGSKSENNDQLNRISNSVQFDDIFNIQFTSGTTGKPKGVMLSHHNLVNNGYLISKRMESTANDRICLPVPLFHCFAGVGGVMSALNSGATCIFPSPGFDPLTSVNLISEEKCTLLYGTPTMHVDMTSIEGIEAKDFKSLRFAVTAGSICPEDLARRMTQIYGCNVMSFYGLTETSPVILQSLPNESEDDRVSTVGYPQEHTEVKIINKDGDVVKIGEEGELCARGYMTMLGYWEDEEKTREVLDSSRWFHTGDTFVMSPTGHGRIVGRLKDMIIRGGENIYPREIEDFLHSHEKIREAHVFGIPHKRLGEEVAAWIRVHDNQTLNEAELIEYCKEKISHFKVPKHIYFRSDFPKTSSGKIQKYKMRKETMKLLGIED